MAKSKIFVIVSNGAPAGFMTTANDQADVLLPESFFEPHTHSVEGFEAEISKRGIGIDLETLADSDSL